MFLDNLILLDQKKKLIKANFEEKKIILDILVLISSLIKLSPDFTTLEFQMIKCIKISTLFI